MATQTNSSAVQSEKPLCDCTYDVLTIVHAKSKALEAYDEYIPDMKNEPQLLELIKRIQQDDRRHIEELKSHLARLLAG